MPKALFKKNHLQLKPLTSSPYFYPAAFVLAIALIFASSYYRYQKMQRDMRNRTGEFNFPERVEPGYFAQMISFYCYDLKFLQYALGTCMWMGALLFLTMSLDQLHLLQTSIAVKIVDALTTGYGLAAVYFGVLGSIIFYIYYRPKIEWDHGLTINGAHTEVTGYYVRKSSAFKNIVYLETAGGWKMLVPAAPEATHRIQDPKLLKQQREYNQAQVDKLQDKLIKQGVPERPQPYFVKYLLVGFCSFLLFALVMVLSLK